MFKKTYIYVALVSSLWAREYNLKEFIKAIDEGNHQIQALQFARQSQAEEIGAVERWKDPSLGVHHFIEPIQTRSGNQNFKWNLRQELPFFNGSSERQKQVQFKLQQSEIMEEKLRSDLYYQAKKVFAHHLWLMSDMMIQRELYNLIFKKLEWLQQNPTAQADQTQMIMKLQLKLEELSLRIAEEENDHRKHVVMLSHLIGHSEQEQVKFSDEYIQNALYVKDLKSLMQGTYQAGQNFDLKLNELNVQIDQVKIEEEQSGLWPKISIQMDYYQLEHPARDPMSIGVNLQLPIYRGDNHKSIRAVEYRIKQRHSQMKHLELEYQEQWQVSILEATNLLRTLDKYEKVLLPHSKKMVEHSENVLVNQFGRNNLENWFDNIEIQLKLNKEMTLIKLKLYQEFAKLEWLLGVSDGV